MKSASLFLTIALSIAASVALSTFAIERRLEKEANRQLAFRRPKIPRRAFPPVRADRELKNLSQSKLTRLVNALKAIRRHRKQSRKQKTRRHKMKKVSKMRRNHLRQRRHLDEVTDSAIFTDPSVNSTILLDNSTVVSENSTNVTTTETSLGPLEAGGKFIGDTAESAGKFVGYIPEKMGFDYSDGGDYMKTGLGAIGFSYGLYDYYRRQSNSKAIFKLLGDRYNTNGIHNAALEQENSNLVYINKKLIYIKGKADRSKKSIEIRVHELDTPLFK